MGPQAVDRDRRSIGGVELAPLLQLAVALETLQVERVDVAVAEIPDEQVSAELPEIGGGKGQPPRGVQPSSGSHAAGHAAAPVEGIHETGPHAGDVLVPGGV